MSALLRPLFSAVTFTRWLHMLVGSFFAFLCAAVYPGLVGLSGAQWALILVVPIPALLLAALVPAVRLAEGIQARVMLFPGAHAPGKGAGVDPDIAAAPSASRSDRARTALWLVLRLEVGCLVALCTGQAGALTLSFVGAASGAPGEAESWIKPSGSHWAYAFLIPLPPLVLTVVVAVLGAGMAAAARRLLGPSPRERLAALEQRTEQLLERHRIARELHDSLGHALNVAVVQAGAARAIDDPEFTDRALAAIEETGRTALDDLDRVLRTLRAHDRAPVPHPALHEAESLLDSARAAGAEVRAEFTGALDTLPGPLSREAYRMLQESLTNVLRHAGPVPVRVRVSAGSRRLELDVDNPLGVAEDSGGRSGSGLRGIRERAELLGGRAEFGPRDGRWQVSVRLPLS
ncbi:two-component sensor histidine kinase [Streptomyces sp. NA04227]|uniref:sensor histidine kinase n=1 Tax=Streptomyces sp. NA04227 TaxID=2742136 RepID=UPI001590B17C|nr:histidine kinase [Streptomyces sp. NA04227]QKW05321.1 two-component sensor histidine kinase [Streptomyces sp. NA04227]